MLDSGALYRLVALAAARRGNPDDPEASRIARSMDVASAGRRRRAGRCSTATTSPWSCATEEAGEAASRVAAVPAVREALLQRQRDFARPPGLVADGRDMGTVVFPSADLKALLTATADERAMRRHKQLKEKGIDVSLRDLSWDIAQRDARDANRPVAPLRPARMRGRSTRRVSRPRKSLPASLQWLEAAALGETSLR